MPYIEPGVYLNLIENLTTAGGYTPALTPLIMGSGATIMTRTEVITRSSVGLIDTLPVNAKAIKSVGYTTGNTDFTPVTDFAFVADSATITWKTPVVGSVKNPAAGENYSVTFTYAVDDTQYGPKLVYSLADIKSYYGTDTKTEEGGAVNPIAVGLRIALEMGTSPVYALQVKPPVSGIVTATEYAASLDAFAKFIATAWRIVPMDYDDAINAVVDAHVRSCSTWEERLERCTIYGHQHAAFTTFTDMLTSIGGYAQGKKSKRITVPYPDSATKLLDDGLFHTLGAPFVAAAYAGLESSMPVQQSKTRAVISCFNELKGIPMTRGQKNALAATGVMILEQPYGAGSNVIVRHQITTDMTSAQTRENSIVGIEDYCSKYLRGVCDQYIGKYNVTPDTITRVRGSLSSAIAQLIGNGTIISGNILSLAQDINNPDTLLVEVEILPPYPCNYIKITLYVD